MRRSTFALAAIAAIALPASAQQSQSVIDKFAVLVPQRVVQKSGHCRKLFAGLAPLHQQWQDKIEAKNSEGMQIQKQLQATGLSDEGKDRLEKQLRDLKYDLNKMQEDASADMEKAQAKASAQYNEVVNPILEELTKEMGLHVVFQYTPGLFAYLDDDAAYTFSDEVAKRVDAKYPEDAGFGATAKPATKPAAKPAGKK